MPDVFERNNVNVIGLGPATMVLAHGFGTDQTAWSEQVRAFQPSFRLVLFDYVGAGQSHIESYNPRRYNALYSYAHDLLEIIEATNTTGAFFVGHSVSGMVGALASILNPKAFSKLILIGASPRYLNDTGYFGGFEREDVDALLDSMSNNYFGWATGFAPLAMGNSDRPVLAARYAESLSKVRPDIAQSVVRVIFESDHRSDLPAVSVPSAIIQSNKDIAVPQEVATYLHKNLRSSTLTMLNTADGHLPHVSAPEETNEAIAAALRA